MNIKLRNDYVLVELPQKVKEEKTQGGIYVPAMANVPGPTKQAVGFIEAVGPSCVDLKRNMRVMYPVHAGLKHTEAGKEYVLLKADEVIGILDD